MAARHWIRARNFDSRSFRLNDEANLNVLDRQFAQRAMDLLSVQL